MFAAAPLEQLESLAADPPVRARVIPLAVAGAFHTEHMAGAVDAVRGTQLEVLQDAPAGQNPIRYHLAQGRLKNALFYAKNSSDAWRL